VGTTIIDGSISLKNQRILGLGSPSDSSDAVNKYYVDSSLLNYTTNVSINDTLNLYLKEASLGTGYVWNSGKLDVSTIAGSGVSQDYVDGSLATKTDFTYSIKQDASIAAISGVSQSYVDGSLSTLNASINSALYSYSTNASVNLVIATINASLGLKTDFTYSIKQDASIGLKTDFTYSVKQDASITALVTADKAFATNASVGLVIATINASLGLKTDFTYDVKQDASIGLKTDFTYSVKQDASIAAISGVSQTYVDGSLSTLNASVNATISNYSLIGHAHNDKLSITAFDTSMLAYATNASINIAAFATNASINTAAFAKNASFGLYATNASVNAAVSNYSLIGHAHNDKLSIVDFDTSMLAYATNASVNSALYPYATNASVNLIITTINASLGLTTTNASVNTALGAYTTNASANANLISKISAVNSSTATEMRFDKTLGYVYGTIAAPLTGAITVSTTGALLGVVSLAIHQENSTGIAVPASFKKIGGTYDGCTNNFIYVQYLDSDNQVYTINKIQ